MTIGKKESLVESVQGALGGQYPGGIVGRDASGNRVLYVSRKRVAARWKQHKRIANTGTFGDEIAAIEIVDVIPHYAVDATPGDSPRSYSNFAGDDVDREGRAWRLATTTAVIGATTFTRMISV